MSFPLQQNTAGQSRYVFLFDGVDIVTTPTIAAGDFQVSIDGGAFNNLATLPSETPAASGQVEVAFSQAETNGTTIAVRWIDQAGAEWDDGAATWETSTSTLASLAATLATIITDIAAVCSCVTSWFAKHVSVVSNKIVGRDEIEIRRGDTLDLDFTRLGDISTRTNIWFTVKDDKDNTDANAWIQIDEDTGLLYINKGAATVAANGSITVTDAVAGDMTIALAAVETAKLGIKDTLYYDLQVLFADGTVSTFWSGRVDFIGDVSRVTS